MTAAERKELLTAGCHLATLLQNAQATLHPEGSKRISYEMAVRRWDEAYSVYMERNQTKKTRRV